MRGRTLEALDWIRSREMTGIKIHPSAALQAHSGWSAEVTGITLKRLMNAGYITRVSQGKWRVADDIA